MRVHLCPDRTHLSSLAGEVVSRLEGASDALFNVRVAAIVGRQNRVLEAAGVFNVHVQLAVLALLGDRNAGADGSNVGIEDERHDSPVTADLGAHGSLRAPSSSIADATDLDLCCVSLPSLGSSYIGESVPGLAGGPHQAQRWGEQQQMEGELRATSC